MAAEFDLVLRDRQLAAGGDADLLQHEIDAGDHLGDRMLDLDARVHLDEIELAVLVEEFDRADAEVLQLAHGVGDDLADLVAGGDVERGRGAFLHHLLVAALQRAVALAEMDGVAAAVADHLDLDVARALQIFFEIDGVVAERGLGLGAGGGERGRKLVLQMRDLHAAAAAAGRGLHQHRKADLARDRERVLVGGDAAVGARHAGDAERLARCAWPRSCRPSAGCARPWAR